jgi:hypothetical protein
VKGIKENGREDGDPGQEVILQEESGIIMIGEMFE